jgi:hypothetical protein
MIAVLFARQDSRYKQLEGYDVYDIDRDARNYSGSNPVIAHPPCRAWGRLSHMANPRPDEKQLAYFALEQVRKNGGILEHPKGSKLWKEASLPMPNELPDEFGGFTILIDQYHFGHVARKWTHLYIVGIKPNEVPPIPFREGSPWKTICGITGQPGRRCTQYEREYTPDGLITFMTTICEKIKNAK